MKTGTARILHQVMIFFGFLFLLWGLLQWQTYTLAKDKGPVGDAMLTTEEVPPGSIVFVHTTSNMAVDTRVVRLDSRELAYSGNNSYTDRHLAAGGPPGGGVGTDVSLWTSSLTPTKYMIIVKFVNDTSREIFETDLTYRVDITIWTPNFLLLVSGFVVIFCTFTLATVLGIGIFGPGVYRPKGKEAPLAAREPAPAERPLPPVPAPAPAPIPIISAPPPVRRPPPPAVPPPEPAFEPRYEVHAEEVAPPPPPPARKGEPLWDVSPARVERPPAPVEEKRQPLKKIKCSACGAIIPVYTNERPLRVTCPLCGRQGTLR